MELTIVTGVLAIGYALFFQALKIIAREDRNKAFAEAIQKYV